MPVSPQTAGADPVDIDARRIAGHLAAICDRAVAHLERAVGHDGELAPVLGDLRDVRDLLTLAAEDAIA